MDEEIIQSHGSFGEAIWNASHKYCREERGTYLLAHILHWSKFGPKGINLPFWVLPVHEQQEISYTKRALRTLALTGKLVLWFWDVNMTILWLWWRLSRKKKKRSLLFNVCWFSWYSISNYSEFQASMQVHKMQSLERMQLLLSCWYKPLEVHVFTLIINTVF